MPFDMGLSNLPEFGFGEFQPQQFSMGDPSQMGGFSMPPISPMQQMETEEVVKQKKKKWLDQMADRLVGDKYYGTNEFDKKQAMGDALIALGQQFTNASKEGSWGALAGALASGLPTATNQFKQSMTGAEASRANERTLAYQDKKRVMDLETDSLQNRKMKDHFAQEDALAKESGGLVGDLTSAYSLIGDDPDISPVRKKAYDAKLNALIAIHKSNPGDPQTLANIGNLIDDASNEANHGEVIKEKIADALAAKAAEYGMPVNEFVASNRLELNEGIIQRALQRKATQANIAQSYQGISESKARVESIDDGLNPGDRAKYNRMATVVNMLERDGDFIDSLTQFAGGTPIEDKGILTKMKIWNINSPQDAANFIQKLNPMNRSDLLMEMIGKNQKPSEVTPDQMKLLSSLPPDEQEFMRQLLGQ